MKNKDSLSEQAAEMRRQAEDIVRKKAAQSQENLKALSIEEIQQMLHELKVHQIELEMQNEELRTTQAELDAARARYFDFYDLAPVGYLSISEKGLILETNLTTANLLGAVRNALVKQPISRFILKDDQDIYYRYRKQLLETGDPRTCELRMVKMDGTAFWAHLATTAARDTSGATVCRIVLSDITERKRAEEALRTSLMEKEMLLKEVHHRVKNNLAAIMGLLDMQGQMDDKPARTTLTELSARIRSMALVHEQLYHSENFSRIDFQDYIEALMSYLFSSFERSADIRVSVAAKGVQMGLDSAVPCGLLITELVTNALKYAFPADRLRPGGGNCEIAVSMQWDGTTYTLTVADNGVGLPVDLDWKNTKTLGLQLVKMLGQHQLQGRIELDRTGGTTFRLRFEPKVGESVNG
ncbi:MAG: PAS domain S-box protein [Deltaproteobacteria bacterium]|nr:PAS domain S-box protein [Deltaproteobacteria bacterium]